MKELVKSGHLSEDISSAINAELKVTADSAGKFSVQPTTKFYGLSLLLADAYFSKLLGNSYPQLTSIPLPLNYIQWNMGEKSFAKFLESADKHRQEPAQLVNGQPRTIEEWAVHTVPAGTEFRQPRANAVRFLHYMESYRPIFASAITRIKPGMKTCRKPRPTLPRSGRSPPTPRRTTAAGITRRPPMPPSSPTRRTRSR